MAVTDDVVAEGKTKIILPKEPGIVRIRSKKDITAGDGAKHDVFEKKDEYATATTCAVFELLNACGIPTAFRKQLGPDEFEAVHCTMLPYEVVARRIGLGSYLKRNSQVARGQRFEALVVEFYLKTTGKRFGSIDLPKDDPLIHSYGPQGVIVMRPDKPIGPDSEPIRIPAAEVYGKDVDVGHPLKDMERLVRHVFLILEKAWQLQHCQLCDLKIEFGFTPEGKLVVADVIDNDSWRVFDEEGEHLDKQRYRDGDTPLEKIAELYRDVAQRTDAFTTLHHRPRIILWCASEKDDPKPFKVALRAFGDVADMVPCVGSLHKQPEWCLKRLREVIGETNVPMVIIVYVGRSNGAGPTIAADTHVPVITVPASWKDFPDDVWSSLRTPSENPLLTCLDPANAVQAALGILSTTSPHAYAAARSVVENRKLDWSNSPTHARNS